MGYYTDYLLSFEDNNSQIQEVLKELNNLSSYPFYIQDGNIVSGDEIKWYNYEKDMLLLSKKFPELVFYLSGIGEENYWKSKDEVVLDVWQKKFSKDTWSEISIIHKIEKR